MTAIFVSKKWGAVQFDALSKVYMKNYLCEK
jgi:hypothetical protein